MERRVNIICNYASIYAGNFIPSILNLCEKLESKHIVFSFPIEAENRNWITHIKSKGYSVFFYQNKFFKKDIRRINHENRINIVYTHFISGLKIKTVVPFNRRVKLFIHVHSDFSGNKKSTLKQRLKRTIEKRFIRKDAKYIFVSEPLYLADCSKNKYYVHNALCLERIFANELDKKMFLKEYAIDEQKTIFLLFGWSPYIKGVDLAVKSFLNLPEELQKKAELIIVYGKDDGRTNCIDFLVKQIGNNSFLENRNIIFIHPEEDIFSLYRLADVYVMSSRSEGFSYSLLESLYFNLKCIVNDIEGCAWAKQYLNCLFFPINSVDGLTQSFKQCIGSKNKHGVNSDIEKEFNIDNWSSKIKNIIEK